MKVVSTNIGKAKEIAYLGKKIKTGIYKYPVSEGVLLEESDVKGDDVVDRIDHAGIDKACYLYSADVYNYWKEYYPNLDWNYGMFGENLTIEGLDETNILIGTQYKIGGAIIEVSQPRQPCFKFGIRMETQRIIKQFINTTYSGFYVRVLQNGKVQPGDCLETIKELKDVPTIAEAFAYLYQSNVEQSTISKLLNCNTLAKSYKKDLKRHFEVLGLFLP